MKIFLSYRRDDSGDVSGRINDKLVHFYSQAKVFKDVDSIHAGTDFPDAVNKALHLSTLFLAVIGPNWVGLSGEQKRIDDPDDWVAREVSVALKRRIPLIPLLVRGASMPSQENLPSALKGLPDRQAIRIRDDPDFHRDMDRLKAAIDRHHGIEAPFVAPPEPADGAVGEAVGLALSRTLTAVQKELLITLANKYEESKSGGPDYHVPLNFLKEDLKSKGFSEHPLRVEQELHQLKSSSFVFHGADDKWFITTEGIKITLDARLI